MAQRFACRPNGARRTTWEEKQGPRRSGRFDQLGPSWSQLYAVRAAKADELYHQSNGLSACLLLAFEDSSYAAEEVVSRARQMRPDRNGEVFRTLSCLRTLGMVTRRLDGMYALTPAGQVYRMQMVDNPGSLH